LIAANSACIALYSLTYITQFMISVFDTDGQGIPLNQCFLFMAVPLFFLNSQSILFPAIAFDRLIGALFPIWWI
jgi:hypothetical protein